METSNENTQTRELTFGEKAVGITFNPSSSQEVNEIKIEYAAIIDNLNKRRMHGNDEQRRMLSIAISETQTAQMWAVKAITWSY